MEMQDSEKETLLAAKEAVETNWKNTMWAAVSTKMEQMGARKFPADYLQKEFRKMETAGTTTIAGAYAPTASNGKASTATNGTAVKDEASEDGAEILLAAATEALADGSDDGPVDGAEEEATED
ncbi:MAG: hypothetical protein Q9213_005645 [Squamulea squamosa]